MKGRPLNVVGHGSFLSILWKKKADMLAVGDSSGVDVSPLIAEVDRQIAQALAGDMFSGEGVTKSTGLPYMADDD